MCNAPRNRLLTIVFAASWALSSHIAGAATPEADFAARCAATGVVLCKGLDTETELQSSEMGSAGDGTRQGFVDTAQKASGAGSLKFTFRAGNRSQNIGGYWETDLGYKFVAGDTIHVQYRWRATPEYFSHNKNYWRSSLKQINIHGPNSTCQGSEFTTVIDGGQVSMYTACGIGWHTDVNTNALLDRCTDDCLIQQGSNLTASPNGSGYNCHYQNQFVGDGLGSGCYYPTSNEWITHYEIIKLGTFGGSNSTVAAFESRDGGPYRQWQRVSGVHWVNNLDNNFTKLRFETYMTEIAGSAPSPAYVWYDELIVSKQPIAAPGAAAAEVTPNPPTDVTAN